ncbi:phenazine biosynthesis protein PhzA/PhzB [Streptomyces sp. IMTB 2501]|uniref:nuclear transport factor 2 family protein n=1 Tax=Streptomyces sp. IMTB 2501 TaxID=1776340 RepID=UPI0009701458|nr:nuclear transport factor 2 family protein [Streptomyces sp. IMTB 2501]OLZ63614.1 phenazine biosynthesis protein PhzA/PhzB [Streptomyces sp. IMTB 2501]
MPTPTYTAPEDLYRHSLRLLLDKDIAGWVGLWAEDGVMEFPFAPPGRPGRLEGREAIAAYMRGHPDHIDLHDFPDLRIHRTTEPETIVVEMRGVGRLAQTGAPFDMTYIAVASARDGRFTSYRDYWNPLAVQQPGLDFAGNGAR